MSQIQHSCTDLLRQSVYQIAAGYEDCNDSNELRKDPAGFDIWGDTAEAEFELRVTELERKCLENPDLDIEVMYFELFHPHFA